MMHCRGRTLSDFVRHFRGVSPHGRRLHKRAPFSIDWPAHPRRNGSRRCYEPLNRKVWFHSTAVAVPLPDETPCPNEAAFPLEAFFPFVADEPHSLDDSPLD